ncbi:NfeD family protein [Aromatoleum bremense]|uniref:NfeD family protein n=1 Tax=Aromatoleum bremense TaxID=76115 RepID=A0ABX1NVL0_9RHOO|nr:NfeD family protein [Aromatoleum bremense]NMG16060.1 NfeD family protein [Aromatoleum bremense]QTQ31935.1 NfeD-like domain-containing protein [Aromatoleum bremense]
MNIEWWQWAVAGIVLILAELAIPSFFVIWFGVAALVMALVVLAAPALTLTTQLALWTALSLAMVALWFRVFKPGFHKTRIGTSAGEVIGEVGLLVGAVAPFQRGRVRFQRPVLGAEEWVCLAESEIPAGERVRVVAVEGSFLKVVKA